MTGVQTCALPIYRLKELLSRVEAEDNMDKTASLLLKGSILKYIKDKNFVQSKLDDVSHNVTASSWAMESLGPDRIRDMIIAFLASTGGERITKREDEVYLNSLVEAAISVGLMMELKIVIGVYKAAESSGSGYLQSLSPEQLSILFQHTEPAHTELMSLIYIHKRYEVLVAMFRSNQVPAVEMYFQNYVDPSKVNDSDFRANSLTINDKRHYDDYLQGNLTAISSKGWEQAITYAKRSGINDNLIVQYVPLDQYRKLIDGVCSSFHLATAWFHISP